MCENNTRNVAAGDGGDERRSTHQNVPSQHQRQHQPPPNHVVRRRTRRVSRRNQTAINFLRKFTIGVVMIDMTIALCESNLISTFFLFLTLSSTFDVKPENVIESYCYFQRSGNRMCEDYMELVTGYSAMHPHQSTGANNDASITPTTNHFPTTAPRPSLTEEEAYQLFFAYNQSFYDTPAKFKVEQNLGDDCEFAKLFSKLTQLAVENYTGTRVPQQSFDEVTHQMNRFYTGIQLTKPIVSSSAPITRKEIPQVMDAIEKGFERRKLLPNVNQERKDYISYRSRLRQSVDTSQSPVVVNEKFKNLIQIKDFVRHRWKRSGQLERKPKSTTTATETSLAEPHTSNSGTAQKTPGANRTMSLDKETVTSRSPGKDTVAGEETQPNKNGNQHHPHHQSTIATLSHGAGGNGSGSQTKGGIEHKNGHGQEILTTGNQGGGRHQVKSSSHDSEPALNEGIPASTNPIMKNKSPPTTSPPRANVEKPISKPDKIVQTCTYGKDRENAQANSKSFYTIVNLLQKVGPRGILFLMESTLFNNWQCFIETAKSYMAPNQRNHQESTSSAPGLKCNSKIDTELEKLLKTIALNTTRIPALGLEMKIFSPKTITTAERKRQAMVQIYHDYGASIVTELSTFKEMSVSRSLTSVHWTVKVYSLVWHVTICCILLYGSVFEDKTALHIWGILNILTSLIHFMIEDWINSTFHPEKTAVAIWFFVVYGLYKPLTILLVGTLASEILRKDGILHGRGMFSRLCEAIGGRNLPQPRNPNTADRTNPNHPVSGHFFVISSAQSSRCVVEAEKKLNGINGKGSIPLAKIKMKVNRATVDIEGNLIMHIQAPPGEGIETGSCILCGERAAENLDQIQMIDKIEEEYGLNKDSKVHRMFACPYKCSPNTNNGGGFTLEDSFTMSEDDQEDDEDEDAGGDDDDSDDDDEDEEEVVKHHNTPVPRKETDITKKASSQNNTSSANGPTDNLNRKSMKQPELPPRVVLTAVSGPKNIAKRNASELSSASPPPAYVNDAGQLPYVDARFRNPIDGLIMPPVPDRGDGLLEAPIEGESLYM